MPMDGLRTTVPSDDAQVVEERRQAVAQEALADDEHLAEGERGGEDERRDAA